MPAPIIAIPEFEQDILAVDGQPVFFFQNEAPDQPGCYQ